MKKVFFLSLAMCITCLTLNAQVRQVSQSVKACNYENFLYRGTSGSNYAGVSDNGIEVSYSSKTKKYGVELRVGYRKISVSCSYDRQISGDRYMYYGIEINTMKEAVIVTNSKLSLFLNNNGQENTDSYDETKSIRICVDGLPDLFIYPIKYIPKEK